MNRFAFLIIILALTACSSGDKGVRVTHDQPIVKAGAPSRSEPVFYNGKTYQMQFAPAQTGGYAIAISGMSAAQQKDANGLTTSAFQHFVCKDSEKTKLLSPPAFSDGKWNSIVQCG